MCAGSRVGGRKSVEAGGMPFGFGLGQGRREPSVTSVRTFRMGIVVFGFLAIVSATRPVLGFDSCIHGGARYAEGEYFAPNDTIIQTEGPRQCVQCRCRQGLVLCEIENCPPAECDAPVRDPQSCCLRCTDASPGKEESSDFVFGKTGPKASGGDCLSNGMHFKNGSVWQPVIGPFGVMACVQCRCQEGDIICARVECADLRCSQPRRELGRCCPVCPALALNKKKAFCLPKSSELFVFKTPNVRNNSDRIEYAFLENKWKRDLVKVHTWNLRPRTSAEVFAHSVISRKEFRQRNFQILGSATKRGFRKHARRERKLRNNCTSKCLSRIEKLEKSLLDAPVGSRTKCARDEVDVADI